MNPKTFAAPDGTVDVPQAHTRDRLRSVYRLSEAVSRATGLSEIYEAALRGLMSALGVDRASILLCDADGVMRFKAWHGLSEDYRKAVEGHSPWTPDAVGPQPIVVSDVRLDETLPEYAELFQSEAIRGLAFIPLISRSRLIGKFMLYSERPLHLDDEEVLLAQAIASHVSFAVERQRNEEKLALYREIFANSSEAIAIIGVDGLYLEQNSAHRSLTGYGDADLAGKTPALHLGQDRFLEIAERLGEEGVYRSDVVSTTKTGLKRQIELSAFTVRNEAGETVCHVGIKRDITERKRVEEALQFLARASAALDRTVSYDATLEALASLTLPDLADWVMIDTLEPDGTFHAAVSIHHDQERAGALRSWMERRRPGEGNAAARALAALRPVTLSGPEETARGLFSAAALAEDALLRGLDATAAVVLPLRARGRVLGLMTLVSTVRDYDGPDVALIEDIARRGAIRLDNARLYREAQESDRRKEEFLAVLAHELRNPITPIRTCLELMGSAEVDPASLARWRGIMERQVGNLTRLVDDLLDVARITRGKIELTKESVDLGAVVLLASESTRALFESRKIRLSVSVPPAVRLMADPLRLEQILSNLLHNAAKYTHEGGHVEIHGERMGDTVVVRVRDDGQGIAPDLLPRVFDLFMQGGRASGGLGVGLTLVRTLVGLHGGSVAARSEGPGRGSEFEIRIPVGEAAEMRSGFGAPISGEEPMPRRVLVVDDNQDAASVLGEALRLKGLEVHIAHDGATAVTEALRTQPDVVLLDLGLPDVDGYEVAARLRGERSLEHCVLVAVSGYSQREYRARSAAAGCSFHLVKPVEMAQLELVLSACAPEPRRGGPASKGPAP